MASTGGSLPGYSRRLESAYFSITSESLRAVVEKAVGEAVRTGVEVVGLDDTGVTLVDGTRIAAGAVVDGRGDPGRGHLELGFQKFLGRTLVLEAPHGLEGPVLMDATVPQTDGFRFLYTLPFGERRLLLEDTRYSDTPGLDRDALRAPIGAYAASQGWRVALVEGEEEGSLPIVLDYKLGYKLSRLLINLLYRVSVAYADRARLDAIPRRDVVVYLMNHRSNADYVVVAYVLAQGVSISYAVGEWARVWPLEYVFKSFGSYFIRRRYREPLYHTVLERYLQLITRDGVTQGIFLEGGLTRDGALRPAKIGLLDYLVRTVREPGFDRDIWLVPVGINYDRVLEDRSIIGEVEEGVERKSRAERAAGVGHYAGWNALRPLTGRLRRYGRVAVNSGTPLSVRTWVADRPGALDAPRAERLPHMQALADTMLGRIGDIIPVTDQQPRSKEEEEIGEFNRAAHPDLCFTSRIPIRLSSKYQLRSRH